MKAEKGLRKNKKHKKSELYLIEINRLKVWIIYKL